MSAPEPHPEDHRDRPTPSSSAAWWVAGFVAVIAIVAVAYLARPTNQPTDQQLATASEQGRVQGYVEGSQATQNAQAMQSSAAAQQSLADQAAQQRADALAAAQRSRSAPSADQSGRDASATSPQSSGSDTGPGG